MNATHLPKYALAACCLIWFAACTEQTPPVAPVAPLAYIAPPFEGVDVSFTSYEINASEGGEVKHPTGSTITIPKGAFVNSRGEVVTGNVTLNYREFHNPAEILVSGIPMAISGSPSGYLESAGMMEINAELDGQPLQVNPDARINIKMASQVTDPDYNLYVLDTANRDWKELVPKLAVEQPALNVDFKEPNYEQLAAQQGIINPLKPATADPAKYQFHYKIDLQDFPEMNIYDGIMWEYVGKPGGKGDPANNQWATTAFWHEMKMKRTNQKGVYNLELKSGDKEFTTKVKPVFDAADQEYAMREFNKKYKNYSAFVDQKKAEAEAARKEAERRAKVSAANEAVTRSFEVAQFGIYNCDRFYQPSQQLMAINASFKDHQRQPIEVAQAWLIQKSVNSVLPFSPGELETFKFSPELDYNIVVMDQNAQTFLVDATQLRNVPKTAKKFDFQCKSAGKKIASVDDVEKMMAGLLKS